jgi:hypothetical protein
MDHYLSDGDRSKADTEGDDDTLSDADTEENFPTFPTQLQQQTDMMQAVQSGHYGDKGCKKIMTFDQEIDVKLFEDDMRSCGFKRVKKWVEVPLLPNFCALNSIDANGIGGLADHGIGSACQWYNIHGPRRVYCLLFKDSDQYTTLMVSPTSFTGVALPRFPKSVSTGLCNKCGLLRLG